VNRIALGRWYVPLANHYDRDEYQRKLSAAGFVDVRCESIRKHVFPWITKYMPLRRTGLSQKDAVVELTPAEIERCAGIEQWESVGMTGYAIFSAEKPA
jgi:microcystin synthetase protein McyJ